MVLQLATICAIAAMAGTKTLHRWGRWSCMELQQLRLARNYKQCTIVTNQKRGKMKILAISGSNRKASTNTAMLKIFKKLAPTEIEIIVFEQINSLPIFSPDLESEATPQIVDDFMDMVNSADGIIISSPEYIRAIPGGLKNAIDWMVSRFEIIDKPIALAHASHRGEDMLASLRLVLSTCSRNFLEHIFLQFPLIGMSTEKIDNFLQTPAQTLEILKFINNFHLAILKKIDQATYAKPHRIIHFDDSEN